MRPFLLPLLLLCACASESGGYGPAGGEAALGYREQRIETDRYRVSYLGKSAAIAEDGALRRAAEITLADGYDRFTVISRELTETPQRNGGPRIGVGAGTGVGSGVSIGGSVSLPLGGQQDGPYRARLEIRLNRGEDAGGPESYDARAVLANLGPAP